MYFLNPVIAYHYCGGELVQASILYGNGQEVDCGVNCKNTFPLKSDNKHLISPVPCCTDDFKDLYTAEYPYIKARYSSAFEQKPFVTPGSSDSVKLLPVVYNNCKIFHSPPSLSSKVSLSLIQVYII